MVTSGDPRDTDKALLASPDSLDETGGIVIAQALDFLGFHYRHLTRPSTEQISSEICNSSFVIAHVSNSEFASHYVVVTGQELLEFEDGTKACDFLIADPGRSSNIHLFNSGYSVSEIYSLF